MRPLLLSFHILTLIAALILIVVISYDAFTNISFLADSWYLTIQFWVCIFFMLDFFVEWIFSPRKWHYLLTRAIFLLVSIPYLNIINHYHIEIPESLSYAIRFIPMLRAAYALAIITRLLSSDRISGLFSCYIILLLSSVYFSAIIFYITEHYVNPLVTDFWNSLWWAFMNVTTVGCNINAITTTGMILAVILSAEGLILFPVFTIYITNALTRTPDKQA